MARAGEQVGLGGRKGRGSARQPLGPPSWVFILIVRAAAGIGPENFESGYEPKHAETQQFHSSDIQTCLHLTHEWDHSQQCHSKSPELEMLQCPSQTHTDHGPSNNNGGGRTTASFSPVGESHTQRRVGTCCDATVWAPRAAS